MSKPSSQAKESPMAKRDSIRNLRRTLSSLRDNSSKNLAAAVTVKSEMSRNGVRFSDEIATKEIARVRKSIIDDLFYSDEDLSEFRHEAWCEECGIDPSEFE